MDDRQLIADLLSALEYHTEQTRPIEFSKVAIEAAREYLQKPAQQEPVACVEYIPCCTDQTCPKCKAATPPKSTWVGLTDKEIEAIWEVAMFAKYGVGAELSNQPFVHYARGIEAKLKEKNNG